MGGPAVDLTPEVQDKLASRLREAPVRLAVLFGSQVAGTTTTASDVDIGVAYDPGADGVTDTHLSLVADLTRILGHEDVDVVRLETVDPRVAAEAIEHGRLLVGSRAEATRLREELEPERRRREETVRARVSEAEEAIRRRLERREHG
jgi:predicted nucleotidyltransferase